MNLEITTLRFRGLKFVTDSQNSWAVYSVCFSGDYEPLLGVLRKGDVVLDAGANIGCFSVLASRRARKVLAVEPNPDTFKLLVQNLRVNHASNVTPFNLALSDKEGIAFLEKHGLESHISDKGVKVRTSTVDELTNGEASIIKVDIEGSEVEALAGSYRTLQRARAVLFETHGTEKDILRELAKFGFRTRLVDVRFSQKLRNAATIDFLYDELATRFAGISSRVTSKKGRSNALSGHLFRILYATKSSQAHASQSPMT